LGKNFKLGKSKIFIVEDDLLYSKMLNHKLSMDTELDISIFNDGDSFLKSLHLKPNVVTLDIRLPDISGLELLKKIKKDFPTIQVIVLSGQDDLAKAVEIIQSGAYDYILKDSHSMEKIWHAVHQANEKRELYDEVELLSTEITAKYTFRKYIKGSSAPMQRVFSLLEKSSRANITVTINGETGTGKELAAKAIHFNSDRMKKPFVAINVAAIPKELIESELFGYEKGAFTGADQARAGKFEEANNGTVFLDEIGEMSLSMQSKLLRALQEREVIRLGSNKVIPINVRIIVATHRDLLQEVKEGRFREDLYYRLLGIRLELPPLKERGNDIVLLAKSFVSEFCKENKLPNKDFSQDALEKLMHYSFPGNVRELKAIVEVAIVMSDNTILQAGDILFNKRLDVDDFIQEDLTLEEYNFKIIKGYLIKHDNNVAKVSEKLQIGKSTIYRMIKEGKC
jgi:two-component system response regulator AtoC